MLKFLAILILVFGGVYVFFKYISRKLLSNFFKNAGMNPEQFKNQQNSNFSKQNDEVIYKKDETVILKGEAGKNKK